MDSLLQRRKTADQAFMAFRHTTRCSARRLAIDTEEKLRTRLLWQNSVPVAGKRDAITRERGLLESEGARRFEGGYSFGIVGAMAVSRSLSPASVLAIRNNGVFQQFYKPAQPVFI